LPEKFVVDNVVESIIIQEETARQFR